MKTKTKILFRDSLILLFWICCWSAIFFEEWDWGVFVLTMLILTVLTSIVFRTPKYKIGKVRGSVLFLLVIVWVVGNHIARSHEIDIHNFGLCPNWLNLLVLAVLLIGAVVLGSKVYQDLKFSKKIIEGT